MSAFAAPASRGALSAMLWLLTVAGSLAAEPKLQPYDGPAPAAMTLSGLSGDRISTDAARGDVVLLHFFATWCEPCRPELSSLNRLVAAQANRGLRVLAISVAEPPSRVARFFREHPVAFPVALDEDRGAARAWGVDALPSTVVLDRSGRPALAVRSDLDWSDPDVARTLEPLLAETGGAPDQNDNEARSGPKGGDAR